MQDSPLVTSMRFGFFYGQLNINFAKNIDNLDESIKIAPNIVAENEFPRLIPGNLMVKLGANGAIATSTQYHLVSQDVRNFIQI